MSVIGSNEKNKEFLVNLNPKKLASLVADILSIKGHTNIRIVDGTGDGCRDIYSITRDGKKHVTQCKYHENIDKKSDSREIGELPLALVKFGYKTGLFVTNAKVSPQVKREFLDNYPGYELDFMTGTDLIREVYDNLILQSIWNNNTSIDKASYAVLIPIVCRNLISDKFYKLLPGEKEEVLKYDMKTESEFKKIEIRIKRNWYDRYAFEPYRTPLIKTFSEPWTPRLYAYEALISGVEILDDIISIYDLLKKSITNIIANNFGSESHLIAVRLGKPHISLLAGKSAGSHIELPFGRETIFIQNSKCYTEYDFIVPSTKANWSHPDRVQASQSSWARWYNSSLDICLNLGIRSVPNSFELGKIEEEKEFITRWWNKSLFALVPHKSFKNAVFKTFVPSMKFSWSDDVYLCAWLQPSLSSNFRPACIENDEDELDVNENIFLKEFDMNIIKENIFPLGIKLIESNKARHMFAIVNEDPYPTAEETWYLPVEMIYRFNDIPSPISPESRMFEFNVCWRQLTGKLSSIDIEKLNSTINDYLSSHEITSECCFRSDLDTIGKENYIVMDLFLDIKDKYQSTDSILNSIYSSIENMIQDIENVINRDYLKVVRATSEYWFNEIAMTFNEVHDA